MSLVRADAIAIPLADESVDLVVTSCPYWSMVDYDSPQQIGLEDDYRLYLDALDAVMVELRRVLKPAGSVFFNIGDKMAESGGNNNPGMKSRPKSYIKQVRRGPGHGAREGETHTMKVKVPASVNCGDVPAQSRMGLPWRFALRQIDAGWKLRAPIIWHKNCLPQNASDRVEIKHEDIFHFAKTCPCYADTAEHRQWDSPWHIPTEPLIPPPWLEAEHPAPYPQEIVRRCVLGWCPPGGVVLDPFGGSGTTAMVARTLGRYPVHIDLSADYLRLARWRIYESGHAAKSQARTDRERQGVLL